MHQIKAILYLYKIVCLQVRQKLLKNLANTNQYFKFKREEK